MAEYIERETTCEDCVHYDICIFHHKVNKNKECVRFKNKADVVEVVRCSKCRKSRPMIFKGFYYCKMLRKVRREKDFCSCGAKMDGKDGAE